MNRPKYVMNRPKRTLNGSMRFNSKYSLKKSFRYYIMMMPGSKGLSPHELAHGWVKDLRTRPDMSIKVG